MCDAQNCNRIHKQVSFYCTTQKDIFWTGCASAKQMVLHLPNETLVKKPKNHFRKECNVEITLLKSLKFSEKDVFPRILIEKDSWHIRTQLNSWCNCLGVRKNPISDVIFLRRIKLKRQFSDNFIFHLPSEKIVVWEAVLSKVHYRKCGL